jgi:hypothetical protein
MVGSEFPEISCKVEGNIERGTKIILGISLLGENAQRAEKNKNEE